MCVCVYNVHVTEAVLMPQHMGGSEGNLQEPVLPVHPVLRQDLFVPATYWILLSPPLVLP